MAEKITIAELDIDVNTLIKSTADVKKAIDQLKVAQTQLTKEGETASEQYVQNASDLKVLNQAYNANLKAISDSTNAKAEEANRTELLNLAIQAEATSIKEAREQNSLLNKLRNETNLTTEEGRQQLLALNAKLDENNEFIKDNADQYLKQKINIGNYSDSIKTAFQDLNVFNGGLGGFVERSKEAGGAGNLITSSLGGMAQGFLGVAKASLAFIATPIGALLALLVGAFALVQNALNRSEEATKKLKGAFSIFSGIINTVLKALEPLGEFLIDGIVMGLELAGAAAQKAGQLISDALSFLGFEDASKAVADFNEEVKNGIKSARDLANAEAELEKAQRRARLTQLQFQKDAEKLRQIRDDETKSTTERIKANEDLGKVLQQQLKEELAIANTALKVANLRIANEGKTKEALDAQLTALTEIADIEERITGQQSEQLVNRNSLIKEANDKAKELAEKRTEQAIRESKAQLDLFLSEQGIKAKSLEDSLKLAEQIAQKQIAINQKVFDASKKTEADKLALQTANNEARNTLLKSQADLVLANVDRELQIYKDANKSQLDGKKFLTQELAQEEINRLNRIAEEEAEAQTQRLVLGQITEAQYQDAIKAIDDKFYQDKSAVEEARRIAEAERKAIDLENERLSGDLAFQDEFQKRQNELELQRQQELDNAVKTGANIQLINKKFNTALVALDKQKEIAKIDNARNALNSIQGLVSQFFGDSKALNTALALADTFLSVQKAYLSQFLPVPTPDSPARGQIAGLKALGFGLANVAKIQGLKFEDGGAMLVGGNRHSAGGTKFVGSDGTRFEAEKGELIGVLNRSASRQFMAFNDAFGSKGQIGTNYAQSGGIIARNISTATSDFEAISSLTIEAIRNQPPPVVAVSEINQVANNVQVIENGATFG
jgi:hypothetical protein